MTGHVFPAAEVTTAAAEETVEAWTAAADVAATAELEATRDAEPEAATAAEVAAAGAAPEFVATTAAAVLVAEEEATPPVPAAARAEDTEVHAGFLDRFSSYRQAWPAPSNVSGTQEYYMECQFKRLMV